MSNARKMKVGALCEFSSGHGFKKSEWSTKGLPIIRIQNLNGNASFNYYSGEAEKDWIVEPGELLFAWAGTRGVSFGPTRWKGPRGVLNQHIYRVRPNPEINSEWLNYALHHVTERIERKAHGFKSSLVHVKKADITNQVVYTPDENRQKLVASILGTWDRGIETLESLIIAKFNRRCTVAQRLLTNRLKLTKLSQPWKSARFGDFLTESRISGSTGETAKKLTVRLYGRGVVGKREARLGSSNTKYYVRRSGQLVYSKLDFLNGAFAIIPLHLDGYETTLDLPAFDISAGIDPRWLLAHLTRPEFYEKCVGYATGGRKARRVNPDSFLRIQLRLPSFDEQCEIGDVIEKFDRELALHRQQLDALREQKRGLMQKLLTGEIRVKPD